MEEAALKAIDLPDTKLNSVFTDLQTAFKAARELFYKEQMRQGEERGLFTFKRLIETRIVDPVAKLTNQFSLREYTKEYNSVFGIDPFAYEPWLDDVLDLFVADNVRLIKSVPTDYFDEVESVTINAVKKGLGQGDVAKQIRNLTRTTKTRAALIARDQVGKLTSSLYEQRGLANGATKYRWHTNIDGRERSEHKDLHNTVHEWSNPPVTVKSGKRAGERNNPGEDIQCRCWAENIYKGVNDEES